MSEPGTSDQPALLATVTGEYFQPVRLHYRVSDHDGLLRAFKKLRCLQYERTQQRWVWLYDYEAKKLRFKRSYDKLGKDLRPIVLGSFFLRRKDKILHDLRSCERALLAIPFFDKHLPRSIARVTEAEIVNKLFPVAENLQLTPDRLFDQQSTTPRDPDAAVRGMIERTARVLDPLKKLAIAMTDMQSRGKQLLPEIERIPIHYYEDGIGGFTLAVRLRQTVALEHWLGNAEYTLDDAIQSTVKRM